jgi:hypothetical protein
MKPIYSEFKSLVYVTVCLNLQVSSSFANCWGFSYSQMTSSAVFKYGKCWGVVRKNIKTLLHSVQPWFLLHLWQNRRMQIFATDSLSAVTPCYYGLHQQNLLMLSGILNRIKVIFNKLMMEEHLNACLIG